MSILSIFSPAPSSPEIASDPEDIRRGYRYWQPRILTASTAGYAIFYFVRVNLPIAMPRIEHDLHITKTDLGIFLTMHGVVYGVSKFLNGFLGDRCNARTFMATGLLLSALANIAFGSASLAVWMGIFWILNGWFQGMGFPPCARLLTHWFPPKNFATKMGIWNMSHSIGGSIIAILCGYLVVYSWRYCFYVPAAIALCTVIYLLTYLRDTPESLGLPPVEYLDPELTHTPGVHEKTLADDAQDEMSYSEALRRYVYSNPYVWLVTFSNFFVYTIRYSFLNWAPTFLTETKGIQLTHAGWITAGFEFAGMTGALCAGIATDRFFGGKPVRVAFVASIACGLTILLFWHLPKSSELVSAILIATVGFFIYIPQCLIGIAAAKLATKRAAAAAVGLTGLFGYASTILSGYGLGYLVDHHGWPAGFLALTVVAGAAALCFAAAWRAPAHG